MTGPDGRARPEDQIAAAQVAMEAVADLIAEGSDVVVTHGNGPQVGNLLVKNELAAAVVPPVPLDWCGAQTQATLGFVLMNALDAALAERAVDRRTATVVTRTLVASNDSGFTHPTKPIGRYLSAEDAALLVDHGETWEDRGERGWRRVVASPEPLEILDGPAVHALVEAGHVVVANGGGGIPVVREDDGSLRGVEAVIDKDLGAALLARTVAADVLVVATDVPQAVLRFGTPHAEAIGTRPSGSASGVPKWRTAFGTSVAMTRMSASTVRASRAAPRSLSMTASTPRSTPPSETVGIPPPPFATTTYPASTRARTAGPSSTSSGSGEPTIRRHPFSPQASQRSPCSISRRASASGRNRPIGLVGRVSPGSSAATRVRVTTVALGRRSPRAASSLSSAFISVKPSVAWVCAPHQSSGTGGTTAAASSFFTRRLPTCGPFPWVTTTSAPASIRSATARMATTAAACWSSTRARPSAPVMALPPSASKTLMQRT